MPRAHSAKPIAKVTWRRAVISACDVCVRSTDLSLPLSARPRNFSLCIRGYERSRPSLARMVNPHLNQIRSLAPLKNNIRHASIGTQDICCVRLPRLETPHEEWLSTSPLKPAHGRISTLSAHLSFARESLAYLHSASQSSGQSGKYDFEIQDAVGRSLA